MYWLNYSSSYKFIKTCCISLLKLYHQVIATNSTKDHLVLRAMKSFANRCLVKRRNWTLRIVNCLPLHHRRILFWLPKTTMAGTIVTKIMIHRHTRRMTNRRYNETRRCNGNTVNAMATKQWIIQLCFQESFQYKMAQSH